MDSNVAGMLDQRQVQVIPKGSRTYVIGSPLSKGSLGKEMVEIRKSGVETGIMCVLTCAEAFFFLRSFTSSSCTAAAGEEDGDRDGEALGM